MATITITLTDTGEDIALKIVSKEPELPLRSDIRSSDSDLTPAQAMAFEMIELYVKANHVEEGDDSELKPEHSEPPTRKCCGGGCHRKKDPEGGGEVAAS